MTADGRIFDTNRRIRLGIWGLGRGLHLAGPCEALNLDVVAGLDHNPSMRAEFVRRFPEAAVTSDLDAFLAADCDAVLLASYFHRHAEDAILCLRAGKHVLSEVTAATSMEQCCELLETVRATGRKYMLAENYCYFRPWSLVMGLVQAGLFGEV